MKGVFGAQSSPQSESLCTKGVFCAQSRGAQMKVGVAKKQSRVAQKQTRSSKERKLLSGRKKVGRGCTVNEKKW